jgi:hypothetical protein
MNSAIAATASSSSSHTLRAILAIVFAGFVCGTLDGLSALVMSSFKFTRLFQFIASGLLGPSSFSGGLKTALLGVLLHYTIAFGATIVFFVASRFLPILLDYALIFGVLYGVCVHFFMSYLVVPMSAIGHRPRTLQGFLIQLAIHMIIVGPSIALVLKRFLRP